MKTTKISNHWLIEANVDGYITTVEDKPIEERSFFKTIRVTEESLNSFRDALNDEIELWERYISEQNNELNIE